MKLSLRYKVLATITSLSLVFIAGLCCWPVHGLTLLQRWREQKSGWVMTHAETREPMIALTFDDGPDPRYTPRVLDILKQRRIHATFFVLGRRLEQYPELARRIAAEGHAIGNHTLTHPRLEAESEGEVRREMLGCDEAIRTTAGLRTHLFRPPRGLWNPATFRTALAADERIILWSFAFDRSGEENSAALRRRVINLARPGDIILFHDGSASKQDERGSMIRELESVIDGLGRRGFRFATVPELLHIRGNEPADR